MVEQPSMNIKPISSGANAFTVCNPERKRGKDQKLENMRTQASLSDEEFAQDQEKAQKSSSKSTMRMLSANEALKNAKLDTLQTSKLLKDQLNFDKILTQLKVPKQAHEKVKDILSNPEKLAQALKEFKMPSISANSKTFATGQAIAKKASKNPEAMLKSFGINIDETTLQKSSKDLMAILQMAYKALADALIANSKSSNDLANIDQAQQQDHVKYLQAILTDVIKTADKAIEKAQKAKFWDTFKKVLSGIVGGLLIVIGAVLCCIPGCELFGAVLIIAGAMTIVMGCFGDQISKGIDDLCDKIQDPKLREIAKIAAKVAIAVVVAAIGLAMIIATGGTALPVIIMAVAATIGSLVGTFAGLGGTNDTIELYDDTKFDCDMEKGGNALHEEEVQKQQKIVNDIVLAITILSAVVSLGAGIASMGSIQTAAKNIASSIKNAIGTLSSVGEEELETELQEMVSGLADALGEDGSSSATANKSVSTSEEASTNAFRNIISKFATYLQKGYQSKAGQNAMRAALSAEFFGQGTGSAATIAEAYASEQSAAYLLQASRLQTNFDNSTRSLGIGTQMMKQDESSREAQTAQSATQERVREDVVQQTMEQQARIISEVAV